MRKLPLNQHWDSPWMTEQLWTSPHCCTPYIIHTQHCSNIQYSLWYEHSKLTSRWFVSSASWSLCNSGAHGVCHRRPLPRCPRLPSFPSNHYSSNSTRQIFSKLHTKMEDIMFPNSMERFSNFLKNSNFNEVLQILNFPTLKAYSSWSFHKIFFVTSSNAEAY